MKYTAYSEKEYNELPEKYRSQVVGLRECNNIMKAPLCPECSGYMMEQTIGHDVYLSCTECGTTRKMIILG